jgi:hypothetical protein
MSTSKKVRLFIACQQALGTLALGGVIASATLLTPGTAQAGDFVDTRINFTLTDEDLFVKPGETVPSVPGLRFGPPDRFGVLFFDNYDTLFSGYENLTHLVLYKKESMGLYDVEGSFVERLWQQPDGSLLHIDDGSYVKVTRFTNPDRTTGAKVSLTAFPISGDRFRLGYSYRISWGGSPIFTSCDPALYVGELIPSSCSFTPVPALKLQANTDTAYAFVGAKTTVAKNPLTSELQSWWAALGGAGYDVTPTFRVEANGGFFNRPSNPQQQVLGAPVQTLGGSAQVTYHVGRPVSSSVDYNLYQNQQDTQNPVFAPEVYDPAGPAQWLVSAEGTMIGTTLQDPDHPNSTVVQTAYAGDVNFRDKLGWNRIRADVETRSLSFIMQNQPSVIPYTDFGKTPSVTPEYLLDIGGDHHFIIGDTDSSQGGTGLTAGATAGVLLPATYHVPALGPQFVGNQGSPGANGPETVVFYDVVHYSILPPNKSAGPEITLKATARLDFATFYAAILDVYYTYDSNLDELQPTRASTPQMPVLGYQYIQRNLLGFNLALQARF